MGLVEGQNVPSLTLEFYSSVVWICWLSFFHTENERRKKHTLHWENWQI